MAPTTSESNILLISHSGKDEKLALALIELVRAALGLLPYQIRCSSVDGYRLAAGVNTEAQLRAEVNAARIVVGVITPHSLASPFVLFELGARWGGGFPMLPILAGVPPDALRGPLSGINALSCDSDAQMYQFVEDLGKQLAVPVQSAASYSRYVLQVKAEADATALSPKPQLPNRNEQLQVRITFSYVPIAGGGADSRGRFLGTVIGLPSPQKYKIVIYALTNKWYVQPLASSPYTDLDKEGNWVNWTHLGVRYGVLVVRTSFVPAPALDSLPDAGRDVIAKAEIDAYGGPNPLP